MAARVIFETARVSSVRRATAGERNTGHRERHRAGRDDGAHLWRTTTQELLFGALRSLVTQQSEPTGRPLGVTRCAARQQRRSTRVDPSDPS